MIFPVLTFSGVDRGASAGTNHYARFCIPAAAGQPDSIKQS